MAATGGTYTYLQDGGRFLHLYIFQPEFVETAYNASVLYKINKNIKIGLTSAFINVRQYYGELLNFGGAPAPYHVIAKQKVIAVMPVFNYSYLVKKNSQLYSEVSFGPAFTKHISYEEETKNHSVNAAFQCTFLGYRLGNRIGAFAELGYGYKGILQLGCSGTF